MTSLDSFPEAFERFETDVDIGKFESYHQLTLSFRWWAGERWRGTQRQWEALSREAKNLGFNVPDVYRESMLGKRYSEVYNAGKRAIPWRIDTVNIKGVKQARYRDLKKGRSSRNPSSIFLLSACLISS